jgi:glycerophosphoryl diester phosphodiesterase
MPAVIAHRGASRAERENTLAAFRAARALGADMVELDVRRTADGALVVHHDPVLADGRPIVTLARAELPPWLPLLHEAIAACEGMGVNVEIKNLPHEPDFDEDEHVAEAVAAGVAGAGLHGRVLVSSFRLRTIDRVRAVDPSVATAWLVLSVDAAVLDRCARHGHGALHPHHSVVGPEMVAEARRAGLAVNAWTVDDPERMLVLAEAGVDGIVTNLPDVAVRALRA